MTLNTKHKHHVVCTVVLVLKERRGGLNGVRTIIEFSMPLQRVNGAFVVSISFS